MSHEELLLEENDSLKKKLTELQSELDTKNQQLYDYQRQLKTAEVLEKEYQLEIDELQKGDKTECMKLHARIQQLEDELVHTNQTYNNQVQCLESTVTEQKHDIEQLHKDLQSITNTNTASSDDLKKLSDENAKLNYETLQLNETVTKLQNYLDEYQNLKATLEQKLNILQEELEATQEIVTCKKTELEEANHLVQTLQEEFVFTKIELDSLRAKPLDEESKGNSLFAEVEDKRVQMKKKLSFMKTRYLEMKQEREGLLKQISDLRSQNTSINQQWKADISKQENNIEMLMSSMTMRIRTLENLVERYKSDLENKQLNMQFQDEYKVFDSMLKLKSEEIEDLRQKVNSQSLSNSLLSRQLCEANRDLNKWRQQAIQLKSDYEILQNEFEEYKSTKALTCDDDVQSIDDVNVDMVESSIPNLKLKSAIKTKQDSTKQERASVKLAEEIKENVDSNQVTANASKMQVKFREDIIACNNVTNRRRGSKVSIAKPVFIPSNN